MLNPSIFCIKMTLFVGYPISYETACTFFKLPIDTKYLEAKIETACLEFRSVGKGQYVLGLPVKLEGFVDVDSSLIHILERKKDVLQSIKWANIDLSDFILQPMDEEGWQRVSNPEPYLMLI